MTCGLLVPTYAQAILHTGCALLMAGRLRPPQDPNYLRGSNYVEVQLVFFSTFKGLDLPANGLMDHATAKLYEPSPGPMLFVAPYNLMLGQGAPVSLVP